MIKLEKQGVSYNYVHNILRHFDRKGIFFYSAQVKRRVIISNKHGINELSHKLPNDLRLTKVLRN